MGRLCTATTPLKQCRQPCQTAPMSIAFLVDRWKDISQMAPRRSSSRMELGSILRPMAQRRCPSGAAQLMPCNRIKWELP